MGKKKRKEIKPWCWYCDREFDDDKILINHQKAKHFKVGPTMNTGETMTGTMNTGETKAP